MADAKNVAIFLLLAMAFGVNGKEVPPKVTRVEMSTEEGFRIYQHWANQALTALMSAFLQAKINDKKLPAVLPSPFSNCYLESSEVPAMAKCIAGLLNGQFDVPKATRFERYKMQKKIVSGLRTKLERKEDNNLWIGQFQVAKKSEETTLPMGRPTNGGGAHFSRKTIEKQSKDAPRPTSKRLAKWRRRNNSKNTSEFSKLHQNEAGEMWRTRFRRGTSPFPSSSSSTSVVGYDVKNVAAPGYSLLEPRRTLGLSPIGGVARLLMANVLNRNNKTETKPWQQTVVRIRELKKLKEIVGETLGHSPPSDILTRSSFQPSFRGDVRRREGQGRRLDSLEKLLKLKKGAVEKPLDQQISDLVRQGIRIGMKLAKQNETLAGEGEEKLERGDGEDSKLEVFSPRFLSITERRADEKSALFSPSVFSLHNQGKGLERELSLPKLMGDSQFTGRDQQEWLNLIMEASGVNDQVDALKESFTSSTDELRRRDSLLANEVEERYKREFKGLYLSKENIRDICGDIEERKVDTWEELSRKFTSGQRDDLNRTGYSVLSQDQLSFLYGPSSPFNDSEALGRLMPLLKENNSSTALNNLIERDIRRIAEMSTFDIRQNDIVLSPSLFRPAIANSARTSQPFILSPFVFSPTILSPTIFGVAILSPRVFSPTILTPRLMTPLILSPFIFSTIILSPIVMQPFILSPGLLNSVILSPFVMNPMIMSSQVMHPFILSPLVMTPGLLNPSSMSPYVLSPFVMNPQVFSPKAISGLILSPYALSPVLLSPTYAYVVILSPSWLS